MKRFFFLLTVGLLPAIGFSADFDKTVTDLVPKLAADNVPDRYAAQMDLQAIASQSSTPGHEAERAELGKVLAAKAIDESIQQPARVWMVRQMEYMGRAEAVESLTRLMAGTDAELRECARRALEKNSAPEASASLRAALEKATDPAWKIGLINSLGQRGDTEAVALIIRHLADAQVAGPAALALGKINDSRALEALWTALAKDTPNAGEALVETANRLAKADVAGASGIFNQLFLTAGLNSQKKMSLRVAALTGLITLNPAGAAPLVEKVLVGNEPKLQQAALLAIARSGDKGTSQMLVALLPRLAPGIKAQAIGMLENPAVEAQVIAALEDNDEVVRRSALEALGRLGTAASVPVLLQAATEDGKPGKSTAEAALARISGQGALAALEKAAGAGQAKARVVALNALTARRAVAAVPAILAYTSDPDSAVKKAALAAVRTMGADAELEPVAKLALQTKSPDALSALEAVAGRVQDKAAASKKLLALAGGEESSLGLLLDPLSSVGGAEALATVVKLSASQNAETQDSAVRALSNWSDFAAVPKLLELSASPNVQASRHAQALQGIVRLVKAADSEPAQARLDAALAALASTRSDEEKKLVLSALATVPHARAAETIKPLLTSATLKAEAGFAGVGVAELLLKTDKDAAKALARDIKAAAISRDLTRRADSILAK